ncbi:MAG: MBL fold metallo-hydrolase [Acutalibacteraceae bacterium]
MINIYSFPVGVLQVNCYVITDKSTGDIAVVDPGDNSVGMKNLVEQHKDKIKYILLTHGHFDHIGYAKQLREETDAWIVIGKPEERFLSDSNLNLASSVMGVSITPFKPDITLIDSQVIKLGNTEIKYLSTPGHTVGSGCYVIGNSIFTGDTLMKGSMGRTDFVTGSNKDMANSLNRLAHLRGDFTIYPGHGDMSTMSYERTNNPYVKSVF